MNGTKSYSRNLIIREVDCKYLDLEFVLMFSEYTFCTGVSWQEVVSGADADALKVRPDVSINKSLASQHA